MGFKFLHTADIHLDSPLQSLERYEGVPMDEIRLATRRAFENVVRLAIDERVAFVLIAGDLYDGDWRDYNTGLYFVRQLVKLKEAGIRTYIIAGNHDAANRMTRSLPWPEKVHLFSHTEPQTLKDEAGAAIHGMSFASQHVSEDLSARYPGRVPELFNIGVLHTCAEDSGVHERYAPCTVAGLRSHQYDYWALGHVHTGAVLATDPYIVFPGNTQGRHIREMGAKGCYVIEVDDDHSLSARFVATDVARWVVCSLDADQASDPDDLEEQFSCQVRRTVQEAEGRAVIVRASVTGRGKVFSDVSARVESWRRDLQARALDAGSGTAWVEKVELLREGEPSSPWPGPGGEIISLIQELQSDDGTLEELAAEMKDLRDKVVVELEGVDWPDPKNPHILRQILAEIEPLLRVRLQAAGGAQ